MERKMKISKGLPSKDTTFVSPPPLGLPSKDTTFVPPPPPPPLGLPSKDPNYVPPVSPIVAKDETIPKLFILGLLSYLVLQQILK